MGDTDTNSKRRQDDGQSSGDMKLGQDPETEEDKTQGDQSILGKRQKGQVNRKDTKWGFRFT